ncbi:hypothetical protein AcV5_005262 [Taiwanofungus camphoratus]|nr:hypothetical protein AcW2_000132 [Antrodia cinnamomea]KAI0931196.1 hypothetical protein AcW2_000132 [Antrodia cinnamomea]KAI0937328.1 hypothetical protein AcV5_005262 [Antrodia cinnamomea]KAI0962541.1 hypothetical protein AcV7_001364 [Antrodia cinnamomea]KAI0962542.1 hypothetical protein AcV7_001364 [Antrodia cinnamomea]
MLAQIIIPSVFLLASVHGAGALEFRREPELFNAGSASSVAAPTTTVPTQTPGVTSQTFDLKSQVIHFPFERTGTRPTGIIPLAARQDSQSGFLSELGGGGDAIVSVIDDIIAALPSNLVAPASALFAEVTSAVDGVASQTALSGVTPTPTSTPVSTQTQIPSATVAKRQVAASDVGRLFSDVNNAGDDVSVILMALLGMLPSPIEAPASSLLAEATAAVGGEFSQIASAVDQDLSITPAAVSPATIVTVSSVAEPSISITPSSVNVAARSTHSESAKANAALSSHLTMSKAALTGFATIVGGIFVGALAVF